MLQKFKKKNSGSQRENCSVLQDFGSLKKKKKEVAMLGTVVIYHDFKKICQHKRSPWIASAGCQSPLMFHCQPQNRLLKHSRIITHACHFQRELSVSKVWWSPILNDSFRNDCKGEALEANFALKDEMKCPEVRLSSKSEHLPRYH